MITKLPHLTVLFINRNNKNSVTRIKKNTELDIWVKADLIWKHSTQEPPWPCHYCKTTFEQQQHVLQEFLQCTRLILYRFSYSTKHTLALVFLFSCNVFHLEFAVYSNKDNSSRHLLFYHCQYRMTLDWLLVKGMDMCSQNIQEGKHK